MRPTFLGIFILCEVSCSRSHHLGMTQPRGQGRIRTFGVSSVVDLESTVIAAILPAQGWLLQGRPLIETSN